MQKAGLAGAFVRHRGLIAFSAGGAMAEAAVALVPRAQRQAARAAGHRAAAARGLSRPALAVRVQPAWLGFTGVLVLLLLARSAVDADSGHAGLAAPDGPRNGLPRPRFLASALSCAVLTVLVWLVMSPVVTLMFGVALVPFSWPYLAAVPILLGTALASARAG